MQNVSLEAYLYLGDSGPGIPLDYSQYTWQQPVDHKGRPRGKVRFGRWFFATSQLDQAAYERVLALMLSDTAVVDARAEYLRADGQGVFVTVWGRRCTVSHVYEHFDSRGTKVGNRAVSSTSRSRRRKWGAKPARQVRSSCQSLGAMPHPWQPSPNP